MIKTYILALFVGVTLAQVPHFGKCPDIGVQKDFDLEKYLGPWYEIEKFFFFIEGQETCITANYSKLPDGHVRVDNKGIQPDGSLQEAIGDAIVEDASEPAKFAVSFYDSPRVYLTINDLAEQPTLIEWKALPDSPRVPYWVVKTDYTSFSLVWSCTDLAGFVQADFAWVLSRTPTLDPAVVEQLENDLKAFGVNTSGFLKTKQDNCPTHFY